MGSLVVAELVGAERRSGAVAAVFSGLTIANIGGVPLASWLAQHVGWRTAFFGIGTLGVIAMVALALALPRTAPPAATDARRELSSWHCQCKCTEPAGAGGSVGSCPAALSHPTRSAGSIARRR